MFSRLMVAFFALSALLVVAMAEHIPRHVHSVDTELDKRGNPSGRGGTATWYHPGLGNCGGHNGDNDMIIALPTKVYSKGKYCGKKIKITNTKTGKSVTATCVDSCPGCGMNDLDVSPKVFNAIAKNLDQGVAPIKWDLA
ncbi:hypothetical protein FRC08_002364 [Ceratobasidium sp. 394]|nr:hypothetical protein FRC08_002364 [Ceratobasidium sp. 394]